MAKVKSKFVKVLLESVVTKHQCILVKLRALDNLEVLRYDPMLQAPSIYKEVKKIGSYSRTSITTIATRGLKKLGYGKHLSVQRYRLRKGLPPYTTASGPITDEPDWSYPDGTPGLMTKGQSLRYQRDQEMGSTMVKFNKQFEAIGKRFQPWKVFG